MTKRKLSQIGNQFELLEPQWGEKEEVGSLDHKPTTSEKEDYPSSNQSEEEKGLLDEIERERSKKRIDETHERKTFLVRKDLLKELEKLSKKYGYGFQSKFINRAIEKQLMILVKEEANRKRK